MEGPRPMKSFDATPEDPEAFGKALLVKACGLKDTSCRSPVRRFQTLRTLKERQFFISNLEQQRPLR